MTMHKDLAALLDGEVHYLDDIEHLFKARVREVFPEAIEKRDPIVH